MDHILAVLHIPAERAGGFIALGEMAGALDGKLIDYLPTITTHLRDAVYYLVIHIYRIVFPFLFCYHTHALLFVCIL